MKRDPVFERYSYAQQANSIKMIINWIIPAVRAHMRKGIATGKANVNEFPQKVIRQLELIIEKLNEVG